MSKVFQRTFARFAVSGASSFILDVGLFQIFCILLKESFAGFGYVFLSGILARSISAVYNYLINYKFVFKSKKSYSNSAAKYFLLAVAQGFCSATFTAIFFRIIQCELELYIKILVDVVLFFVSYVIQKKFVY